MLQETIKCACGASITIPVIPEISVHELQEEYDMAEMSAQEELFNLRWWLASASLFTLLKAWFQRKRIKVKVV